MMEQRTDEWFAARLGKVTASRVADMMARTKTGYAVTRASYRAELIRERLTGAPVDRFVNAAMQWGIDTEPQARAMYSLTTGEDVLETGFVLHPTVVALGASPDGLVGDRGLVEIKCPNNETHIETLLSESVPRKYMLQMQTQMACTGRDWCDFVSFDPRMPGEMQIWCQRVEKDADLIAQIEAETVAFLAEVNERINALRGRYPEAA